MSDEHYDQLVPQSQRSEWRGDGGVLTSNSTVSHDGSLSPEPLAFDPPHELGAVRLIRLVGRGGMGEVWLGRHELLQRDVAVKFLLHATPAPDDPHFRMFLEGARAAAALRRPNLTLLHHADLVDGVPYLVMEYVDGPTAAELLRRLGPLAPSAALEILTPVATAITELHDQGILHRDIKPANVLLDRNGGVFVTDFGLACQRHMDTRSTSDKGVAGTPHYMAPELYHQAASPRSDVYALGITAFELLTGAVPFCGNATEIRQQHALAPLPVERLHERGVNAALIDVLERATSKAPLFRYKTARQFLQSLEAARQSESAAGSARPDLATLVARATAGEAAHMRIEPNGTLTPGTATPRTHDEWIHAKAAEHSSERTGGAAKSAALGRSDIPTAEPTARDLPCVACGYDLRGLSQSGRCPECGAAIERSLRGNLLKYADLAWLTKVRRGVRLLRAYFLLSILVGIPAALSAEYCRSSGWPAVAHLITAVFSVALLGLGLRAIQGITVQEPRFARREPRFCLRRILIGCVVFSVASAALDSIWGNAPVPVWAQVLTIVMGLSNLVLVPGFGVYLRRFALRLPDLQLARHTRIVVIGWSVTAGLSQLLFSGAALATSVMPPPTATAPAGPATGPGGWAGFILATSTCSLGVPGLLFFCWQYRLLLRYGRVLSATIREAQGLATRAAA